MAGGGNRIRTCEGLKAWGFTIHCNWPLCHSPYKIQLKGLLVGLEPTTDWVTTSYSTIKLQQPSKKAWAGFEPAPTNLQFATLPLCNQAKTLLVANNTLQKTFVSISTRAVNKGSFYLPPIFPRNSGGAGRKTHKLLAGKRLVKRC